MVQHAKDNLKDRPFTVTAGEMDDFAPAPSPFLDRKSGWT